MCLAHLSSDFPEESFCSHSKAYAEIHRSPRISRSYGGGVFTGPLWAISANQGFTFNLNRALAEMISTLNDAWQHPEPMNRSLFPKGNQGYHVSNGLQTPHLCVTILEVFGPHTSQEPSRRPIPVTIRNSRQSNKNQRAI
jgi:hypothetical protein